MGPESFPSSRNSEIKIGIDLEDRRPDQAAVSAAESIIGPPPTATPEQLTNAVAQIGTYDAPPQKQAEPLQDPALNEQARNLHITTINAQPPK